MKYWRFRAQSGGTIVQDDEWAFEVENLRIITYHVERTGLLRKKVNFAPTGEIPIRNETEVRVSHKYEASGSGICVVRTGSREKDYNVFGNVDQFATEIERQVAAAARA